MRTALTGQPDLEPSLAAVLQQPADAGDAQALASALRGWPAIRREANWASFREAWFDHIAARLAALCVRDGPGWNLSVDRPHRRLTAAILRRFLTLHVGADPTLAGPLVAHLVDLYCRPLEAREVPAFVGYRRRAGLITDAPDAPLPLGEVGLDLGVRTPYFGDALVAPRVVLRLAVAADRQVELELDGLGALRLDAVDATEAQAAVARLLGFLHYVLPDGLRLAFDDARIARLAAAARRAGEKGDNVWRELCEAAQRKEGLAVVEAHESPSDIRRLILGDRAAEAARASAAASAAGTVVR